MKKQIIFLSLIILLSVPALLALFHPGFFQTDDGEWMIIRFSSFHEELSNGQFPVRLLGRLNFGYGYPVANFLYPGFLYLAEPLHIAGFTFVDSIKILLGVSIVSSSVFTFLWLSKLFDKTSSFFGALVYLYFPYHLYDLYRRGSVGEVLALAVLPFVLWQVERRSLLWTSAGIAMLVLSHNSLAALFIPIVILYICLDVYVSKDKREQAIKYLLSLLLGLGLSAFFWIPSLFDLGITVFSKTQVSDWRNYFADINLVGYSTLAIGVLPVLLFILKKLKTLNHRLTFLMFILLVVSLFLSTSLSFAVWEFIPAAFVQFPFRFLSVSIIAATFLLAASLSFFSARTKVILGLAICVLTILGSRQFLSPEVYFNKGDSFYSTNEDTTTVKNEYMPKWVKDVPKNRPEKLVETKGQIKDLEVKSSSVKFTHSSDSESTVTINKVYFPGWKAKVDGKEILINYESEGLVEFAIPKGEHGIEAKFGETELRLFADSLSVLSFAALVAVSVKKKFL